ncbi:MAG: anion permease [Phaeodactylibacter sp.]|nr:anion permease [Phaeodactylibacter sp.]
MNYGHTYVLMLLAGFFLAKAIELQCLHKRMALVAIKLLGTSRRTIPLLLMITATFACSFAFMLPSGTGTSAVIFASDRVAIRRWQGVGCGSVSSALSC